MGVNYLPGDVIFETEPYVAVLSHKERLLRCDFCFSRSDDLKTCSLCKVVKYCNKKCQKSGWKTHKQECVCLKRVAPNVPTETARLLLRIIQRGCRGDHDKIVKDDEDSEHTQHRCFRDLQSHVEDIVLDKKRMEQFYQLVMTVKTLVGDVLPLPTHDELLVTFGRMTTNSFTICDGEMQAIGVGIYLSPSILDHSCVPNAVTVFNGTRLQTRALCPIQSDTQLSQCVFISYIDQLALTKERQDKLLEQYYFECHCALCQDEGRDHEMLSLGKKPINIDDVTSTINDINESEIDHEEILAKCEACLKYGLPVCNIYHIRVLEKAFDAAICLHQWDKALRFGCKLKKPYEKWYMNPHAAIGIHLMKVGKIHQHLDGLEDACRTFKQAKKIMIITHGAGNYLYKELLIYLDNVELRIEMSKRGINFTK